MIDQVANNEQAKNDSVKENGFTKSEMRLTEQANDYDDWAIALATALAERGVPAFEIAEKIQTAFVEKEKMAAQDFASYTKLRKERGLADGEPDPRAEDHKRFSRELATSIQQLNEQSTQSQPIEEARLELRSARSGSHESAQYQAAMSQRTTEMEVIDGKLKTLAPQREGMVNAVKRKMGSKDIAVADAQFKMLSEQRSALQANIDHLKKLEKQIQDSIDKKAEDLRVLEEAQKNAPQSGLNSEQKKDLAHNIATLRKQVDQLAMQLKTDRFEPLVVHAEFFLTTPERVELRDEYIDNAQEGKEDLFEEKIDPNNRDQVVNNVQQFIRSAESRGDIPREEKN